MTVKINESEIIRKGYESFLKIKNEIKFLTFQGHIHYDICLNFNLGTQ